MSPHIGQVVHYYTSRTQDKETRTRLTVPEPIGPLAAMVVFVHRTKSVNLNVWMPNGRSFPAFDVSTEPSTPVQHYWQEIAE